MIPEDPARRRTGSPRLACFRRNINGSTSTFTAVLLGATPCPPYEIAALTLRGARPLIRHERTEGWPERLGGATCFFLRFARGIIGVTANHVIDAYECALAANPNTVYQLRNSPPSVSRLL